MDGRPTACSASTCARPWRRGSGQGINPEQLFALAYGDCFPSAMGVVGRRPTVDTSASTVVARVTLGSLDEGAYRISVELDIQSLGIALDAAER